MKISDFFRVNSTVKLKLENSNVASYQVITVSPLLTL